MRARQGPEADLHECPRLPICLFNIEPGRHVFSGSSHLRRQIQLVSHLYFGKEKNVISNLKLKKNTTLINIHQAQMVFGKLSLSLLHTPAHWLAAGMGSLASTCHSVYSYLPYGAVLRSPGDFEKGLEKGGGCWESRTRNRSPIYLLPTLPNLLGD